MFNADKIIDKIYIHDSWKPFFKDTRTKSLLEEIFRLDFTDELVPIAYTFPSKPEEIFAFATTDLNKCKAIIVGMEPYPSFTLGDNEEIIPEAIGKSFIVRSAKDKTLMDSIRQASLRNFMKCQFALDTGDEDTSIFHIREEISSGRYPNWTFNEWFQNLEDSGVLFLNAMLTVTFEDIDIVQKTGKKKKNRREIWTSFMELLIPYILKKNNNSKFYLFGKDAQDIFSMVPTGKCIKTCHPRLQRFIKENPFKMIEKEIGISSQKEELKRSFIRLEEIGELEDNWNGNGASAFSKDFLEKIKKIISKLCVQPEIFPTAVPSIQLEFEKKCPVSELRAYIEFEIMVDGRVKMFLENMNGKHKTEWLKGEEEIHKYVNEIF